MKNTFDIFFKELQEYQKDSRSIGFSRKLTLVSYFTNIDKYKCEDFTPEQIKQLQDLSNINCLNCTNCWFCNDCVDCIGCFNCSRCNDCIECMHCTNCALSYRISNHSNCMQCQGISSEVLEDARRQYLLKVKK